MTSLDRYQLAAILAKHINFHDHEIGDTPDAILAAGFRPPPRVIDDPAELSTLPVGSIVLVLSAEPRAFAHARRGYWWVAGPIRTWAPSNEVLDGDKAIVLWEPTPAPIIDNDPPF